MNEVSEIYVDIKASHDTYTKMMEWCNQRHYEVVYKDINETPGLVGLADIFGAKYSKTFVFRNSNDAMIFKLRWC